jgi:hypothetical protein
MTAPRSASTSATSTSARYERHLVDFATSIILSSAIARQPPKPSEPMRHHMTTRARDGICDIQVVNQIDTKFRCRICKQDIVFTSVQSNKGTFVNFKFYKFSCASMWKWS